MINITISSNNNRTIELIPLDTFISQNQSFSNQLISDISYNNYILKLSDINNNFSSSTFLTLKNNMISDIINLTILVSILISIFLFIKYLKRL